MELITQQQAVQQAIQKLRSRYDAAKAKIDEIESTLTSRLISFANGELSEADLDSAAAELSRLREILKEDATPALEHFHRISQELSAKNQQERAKIEAQSRRREFADRYNLIISRIHPPTPREIEELAVLRPHDITGPEWQRFTDGRINFAALPESSMTFGQYLGVEPFTP